MHFQKVAELSFPKPALTYSSQPQKFSTIFGMFFFVHDLWMSLEKFYKQGKDWNPIAKSIFEAAGTEIYGEPVVPAQFLQWREIKLYSQVQWQKQSNLGEAYKCIWQQQSKVLH
jgi:hypothetical protein